jgi:hypothetical protein
MDTKYWGPGGWVLLHMISFSPTTSNKKDLFDFFSSLPYVLPCKYCRASLSEYVREYSLEEAIKTDKKTLKEDEKVLKEDDEALKAEKDKVESTKINTLGPQVLANICELIGSKLLHISTDSVC